MNGKYVIHACLFGGILLTGAATNANADPWNKKTYINTSQSIEVPGAILPPGRYVFKLMNSPSNRHIVQILNDRENHVYATNLAIPKQRMQPAESTILTFYEMPGGAPEPVRSWFYPGDTIGQEFAYPKHRALEISRVMREHVPILAQSRSSSSVMEPVSQPVSPVTTEPITPAETSSASYENSADRVVIPSETPVPETPAETSTEAAASMPDQDQATPPATGSTPEPAMPHTAGNTAGIALLGLSCIGIAVSLRMAGKAAGHRS